MITVVLILSDKVVDRLTFTSLADAYRVANAYADQSRSHLAYVYEGEKDKQDYKARITHNIASRIYR